MTNNQKSKQENQHGQQNQEPKKGQSPNDPKNRKLDPKRNQQQEGHPQQKQSTR